jgi:hypothetical protein
MAIGKNSRSSLRSFCFFPVACTRFLVYTPPYLPPTPNRTTTVYLSCFPSYFQFYLAVFFLVFPILSSPILPRISNSIPPYFSSYFQFYPAVFSLVFPIIAHRIFPRLCSCNPTVFL